jgi:hypothetical protein
MINFRRCQKKKKEKMSKNAKLPRKNALGRKRKRTPFYFGEVRFDPSGVEKAR